MRCSDGCESCGTRRDVADGVLYGGSVEGMRRGRDRHGRRRDDGATQRRGADDSGPAPNAAHQRVADHAVDAGECVGSSTVRRFHLRRTRRRPSLTTAWTHNLRQMTCFRPPRNRPAMNCFSPRTNQPRTISFHRPNRRRNRRRDLDDLFGARSPDTRWVVAVQEQPQRRWVDDTGCTVPKVVWFRLATRLFAF